MLFYVDSKTNKVYCEISKNFFGVDISSQGVKPLEDEFYSHIDYDYLCTIQEVKAKFGIDKDHIYKFPTSKAEKPKKVEKVEEVEEIIEEEKVEKKKVSKKK